MTACGAKKALEVGAYGIVVSSHGGSAEGVELYTNKIGAELRETMIMAGCKQLSDISADKIRL